jgi:N6-L-threonylcarbamoyladenine synthase
MKAHNQFEIVGTTRDDAVGECFDKVAKILGLPYPGGPAIARAAESGDASKYSLPHPKLSGLDFSFSGLKTAVLRTVQKEVGVPISYPSHKLKELLSEQQVCDFAASFQKTAVEILLEKLKEAVRMYPEVKSVVFAGGVSANVALREMAEKSLRRELPVYFPTPKLSGDNGAMVGAACYYEIMSGVEPVDPYALNIYPRISIEK